MRIAVMTRHFSRLAGGAESYAVAVAGEMAQRHEVHVFAQQSDEPIAGLHYHYLPGWGKRLRWLNQLVFAVCSWWVTRRGFDVVHAHENTWHGQVQTIHVRPTRLNLLVEPRGWQKVLSRIRVTFSVRLWAHLMLEEARFKRRPGLAVVSTSEMLNEECARAYPHARSALRVIPPGTYMPERDVALSAQSAPGRERTRSAFKLPTDAPLLLFVANDYRRKGLDALLRALLELPNVHLAVVGSERPVSAYRAHASVLGIVDRVHFLGPQLQMADLYMAADALVHPTLDDTFGMVVLEALAHGLPVVMSGPEHCGLARDLRTEEQALLLNDPHDAQALAQAVQRVLTDHELSTHLRQEGRRYAESKTWERTALQYEALYQQIAAARAKQRWLILAHAFNMDGRAASQTITDKLPHLRAAGIELVVLSGVSGRRDAVLEHHQLWPACPAGFRFELRHVLRRHLKSRVAYRFWMTLASLLLLPGFIVEKLLRPVESSWSWWLTAYVRGRMLARQQPFDLIYSTGGAYAAHLAGRALKHHLNAPWLAEVHDPFVTPGSVPHTPQQKMQARVESMICQEADIAIWFTEQALASARARHPDLEERGKVMLPGIDPPFSELPPYRPSHKLVVGHFGSLSATRNLRPFLRAMELLSARAPHRATDVELHITGGPLDSVSAAYLAQSSVREQVRHFGRIEADPVSGLSGREQILRRMRSVDVLLLLHGQEPICEEYIPSKLYEYLWMQRPILATVHRNPQMAAMLRQESHDVVMTEEVEDGAEALSVALERLWGRWQGQGLPDNGHVSPYTTAAAVARVLQFVEAVNTRGA